MKHLQKIKNLTIVSKDLGGVCVGVCWGKGP